MKKKQTWLVVGFIVLMLLIDQITKFYIKLHFTLGEAVEVFPWFNICFVENNGMAFGIEWFNKFFLTFFRIVVVGVVCWYLHKLIQQQTARTGYVLTIASITAGAIGNIIDCLFYGLIFSESTYTKVATFLPDGGGYANLFYGKVVDMLYFPLIHNGASEVIFFRPVFNIADCCITVAVFIILFFYSKDLNKSLEKVPAQQ